MQVLRAQLVETDRTVDEMKQRKSDSEKEKERYELVCGCVCVVCVCLCVCVWGGGGGGGEEAWWPSGQDICPRTLKVVRSSPTSAWCFFIMHQPPVRPAVKWVPALYGWVDITTDCAIPSYQCGPGGTSGAHTTSGGTCQYSYEYLARL